MSWMLMALLAGSHAALLYPEPFIDIQITGRLNDSRRTDSFFSQIFDGPNYGCAKWRCVQMQPESGFFVVYCISDRPVTTPVAEGCPSE